MNIEVYTDGSAHRIDKPGGWAYVICIDSKKYAECAGSIQNSTNNDAELEAALWGLRAALNFLITNEIKENYVVTLVSDSQLILGWANGSYKFKQEHKLEKYYELQKIIKGLRHFNTRWVQGHSGDEYNERCDKLANEARLSVGREAIKATLFMTGDTLIGTRKSGTIALYYKNVLKVIDLENNIIENYNREVHGSRGSMLEVKEEKTR